MILMLRLVDLHADMNVPCLSCFETLTTIGIVHLLFQQLLYRYCV